jgi:hypothetical protein
MSGQSAAAADGIGDAANVDAASKRTATADLGARRAKRNAARHFSREVLPMASKAAP